MIDEAAVMDVLLVAWPTLRPAHDRYAESDGEPRLLYADLGWLGARLVEEVRARGAGGLAPLFEAIERLHVEGNPKVREAATIGLLEAIQNIAAREPEVLAQVEGALGRESRRGWKELNAFWGQSG